MSDHSKHSPLPWKQHLVDETLIVSPDHSAVCVSEGDYEDNAALMEANAAYIVKACNAYPKLVEALKEIHTICTESAGACRKRMGTRWGNSLVEAQKALRELGELP